MGFPPLYILRHGETEWNAQGRLQGRYDSALTQRGRAQALAQRAILLRRDLTGFTAVSSPQGRAYQTAAIALDGVIDDIHTDERLGEIGLGDWAGQTRSLLMEEAQVKSGFDLYERAPGGEGFAALRLRAAAFLADLQGPSVVVTHGITSRMLRLIALGLPMAALTELPGGQGVVFHLESGIQTRLK